MWTRHDCLFPGSDHVWETLLCCEAIKHPGSAATFVWSLFEAICWHTGGWLWVLNTEACTKPPEVTCCFFSHCKKTSTLYLNVVRGIIRDEVKQGNQSLQQGCHMSITSCLISQYWVSMPSLLCHRPMCFVTSLYFKGSTCSAPWDKIWDCYEDWIILPYPFNSKPNCV